MINFMIIFQNSPREFTSSRRVNQGHQGRPLCGSWMGLMASSMISFLGVLISPTKKASHDLEKWGKPSRISVGKWESWWFMLDSWWILQISFRAEISDEGSWGVYSFSGRCWFPRSSPNPPAGRMLPKCLDAWWVQPIPAFKMFMLCRIHRPNALWNPVF